MPGKRIHGASVDDGSGRKRVVIAVQVPDRFDVANPCIVARPVVRLARRLRRHRHGRRMGPQEGCAVALTDAGKGMGLYDLADDTVNRIDGTRATRSAAGALTHFAANITDAARAAFNAAFPNRLALKHVHSQLNPEKDWGNDTLAAVRYALYALNQEYGSAGPERRARGRASTPANTLVIAGSVSNGGAAVLHAAEQDTERPDRRRRRLRAERRSRRPPPAIGVQFGGVRGARLSARPLIDYVTYRQPVPALRRAGAPAALA